MSDAGRNSPLITRLNMTLEALGHLVWPRLCLNCQEPVQEKVPLCQSCSEQMLKATGGTFCPRCGHQVSPWALVQGACPQCQGRELHFDRLLCCGLYEGPLRQMVIGLKKGHSELTEYLGELLRTIIGAAELERHIDWLVPVPLHWTRQWIRGYNQADLLARQLSFPRCLALKRIRRTPIQPGMTSWPARKRNVAGAFALSKAASQVAGQRICLIDDVKTSGATLNECARVLRQAGAASVWALVLSVAGQGTGRGIG